LSPVRETGRGSFLWLIDRCATGWVRTSPGLQRLNRVFCRALGFCRVRYSARVFSSLPLIGCIVSASAPRSRGSLACRLVQDLHWESREVRHAR